MASAVGGSNRDAASTSGCARRLIEAAGEIEFINGACPGNDYLGAHAPSQLDLALLQRRLNDLHSGIYISIQ
jgi:hypothetical protein